MDINEINDLNHKIKYHNNRVKYISNRLQGLAKFKLSRDFRRLQQAEINSHEKEVKRCKVNIMLLGGTVWPD